MTYEEFSKKQKEILEVCKLLLRDLKFDEFNAKMDEFISLQAKYLSQRG